MDDELSEDEFVGEASTGVSFTSFMTVVTFFFIGLLLTGEKSLQVAMRVPLYYLFVSAYGYLFSTLIYANATSIDVRGDGDRMKRHMYLGDLISEFFGVYFLILAIPLLIYGYTEDLFLGILLLFTGHFAFYIYHHFGYSIMEGFLKPYLMKSAIGVVISINILNFYLMSQRITFNHYVLSAMNSSLIVSLFILTFRASDRLNLSHLYHEE